MTATLPQKLVETFGVRSPMARESVPALFRALTGDDRDAWTRWLAWFEHWSARGVAKLPRHLARTARRWDVAIDDQTASALLCSMQTYYALVVRLAAERFGGWVDEALPENPFSWRHSPQSLAVAEIVERLREAVGNRHASPPNDDGDCDLFKPLYQDLFPRPLRHELGEYYTPDWLAAHVLDQVGYDGRTDARLLDPSCGSGTFLLMTLRRWRRHHSAFDVRRCPIVGFDINPLAVMTARANLAIALADMLPAGKKFSPPVYLRDSILGVGQACHSAEKPFDFIVGNPPWIAWDNLAAEDRQATKPLWEHYGLFSLSGSAARHGGGKKDLSMLMLHATADRHLKDGGRLGMVITQTIFQTRGAGDGFRRFRLGDDGPPLKVLRVDDFAAMRPFDAANWTSVIVLEKGAATQYPVPYFTWTEGGNGLGMTAREHAARPIDPARPTSPWLIDAKRGRESFRVSGGVQPYTAHLGVNSGGANGVFWVEVLGHRDDGVLVRNLVAKNKRSVEQVEQAIEPDLLHPLLRWGDVCRYAAVPKVHVVLAQDPATRTGIKESVMRERFPRTLAYLEQFRELLETRSAYRRYQGRGPFYSMYNVGPYTIAPVKVVWRRMDRRINAVVVETATNRNLPTVPQETCVLVACDSTDEAHYLCAVLNSAAINALVAAHSVRGGKSFGTPGMLEHLPLEKFRPDDPRHRELALLGRQAHATADEPTIDQLQRQIDRLVDEQ